MPLDYLSLGKDPSNPLASGTDYLSLTRDPSPTPETEPESEDEGWNPAAEFSRGLYQSLSPANLDTLGSAMEGASHLGGGEAFASVGAKLQEWSRGASELTDPPIGWDEVKGVLDVFPWLAGQTGSALGSMAPTIAAGALGAAGGTAVGGPAGSVIGAAAGALSAGTLLSFGETYAQLKREGIDTSEASKIGAGVAPVIGAIEALGVGKLFGKTILREIKSKAISKIAFGVAKSYGVGAATEGLTEMAQSVVREVTVGYATGNPDLKRRVLATLEEGFLGALGGGFVGGARQTGQAIRSRKTIEERREEEEPSSFVPTGGPLDDMAQKGAKFIDAAQAKGDTDIALGTLGLPRVGSRMIRTRMDGSQVPQTIRGLMPKETLEDGTELPDTVLLEDDAGLEDEAQWPLMEGESLAEAPTAEQTAVDADLTRFTEELANEIPNLPEGVLQQELEREGVQSVEAVPPNRRSAFLGSLKTVNKQAEKQAADDQRTQEKQAQEQQKQVEQQQKDEEGRVAQEQQDADELLVMEQEVTDLKESYNEIDEDSRAGIDADVFGKMKLEQGASIPKERRKTYLSLLKMGLNSAAQKKAKPQDSNIEMIHAPSGKKYETEYRIVEGETVQPSHVLKGTELESTNPRYTGALQPRDLLHIDERKKINKGSEELDPPLLGRSITPDSGAPIAGEDLQVESGNGRLLMIMRAYRLGKADHYKKYLAEMGFDISGFKQPVLMRVRTTNLSQENRLAAVRDFSTPHCSRDGHSRPGRDGRRATQRWHIRVLQGR